MHGNGILNNSKSFAHYLTLNFNCVILVLFQAFNRTRTKPKIVKKKSACYQRYIYTLSIVFVSERPSIFNSFLLFLMLITG